MSEFTDLVIPNVISVLVPRATSLANPSITYKELATELSQKLSRKINPRNLDYSLGIISDVCKEYNLPLLSTIVINKSTKLPGNGYFSYFFPSEKDNKRPDRYEKELKRVLACKSWSSLYKHFDIND